MNNVFRALLVVAGVMLSGSVWAQGNPIKITTCGTASPPAGASNPYMDANGNLCTAASVSASISGFTAASTGTPISVTTGGVTGTLPAGAVVVATNVGATNGAYCALGASATTSSQYLAPGGGWFAFTVGAATQLTCITSTSTTTVNTTGGAGIATGAGGSGSVSIGANASVNVAQVNGVTTLVGNGATGTGSQRVTVASDNTPFPVKIDQTTPGTTNAVSLAQIGGTTIVNGGVAGSQSVGGTVATNVAITANPLNLGAQAVSSENAAVTTARQVQLVADLVGKLIVLPYSNPENFVSGVTSAMTATTSTSLIAAPAAGLRNYITNCVFSNSHATVGTMMNLQDGSGGTTIYSFPAAPAYGGATVTFPTPLKQPTTATALFVVNATTGANTFAACSGYKGT